MADTYLDSSCGADDDQANSLAKIVSVVALYAGKPELLAKAEEAIRVTQNTDKVEPHDLAKGASK